MLITTKINFLPLISIGIYLTLNNSDPHNQEFCAKALHQIQLSMQNLYCWLTDRCLVWMWH